MAKWTSGPLLAVDLETTSPLPLEALPVSFGLLHYQQGAIKGRYGLVRPGVPIPPATIEIHGITDEMVAERGGDLDKTILGLAGELFVADTSGIPIVAMNARYDLSVIDACYRRLNDGKGLRDDGWNGFVVDPMVLDRHLDKWRKGGRKLSDLCDHYEVKLSNAHHAGADAEAAVLVALAIAKKYPQVGNMAIDTLHVSQVAWRREWARDFSAYRVKNGEEPLDESEGDWPLVGDKAVSV